MCKELAEEEEDEALIKEEPVESEEVALPTIPEDAEKEAALPTIPEDEEEELENSASALPIPGILPRRLVRKLLVPTALDKYGIKFLSISVKGQKSGTFSFHFRA